MKVMVTFEVKDGEQLDEGILFDYFTYMHSFATGTRPSRNVIKGMQAEYTPVGIEVSNEEAEALPEPTPEED